MVMLYGTAQQQRQKQQEQRGLPAPKSTHLTCGYLGSPASHLSDLYLAHTASLIVIIVDNGTSRDAHIAVVVSSWRWYSTRSPTQ